VVQCVGQTLSFQTTNAGEAEVKGVEAEFNAALAKPFTFGVNYSYLHGRFTGYVINNGPVGVGVQDLPVETRSVTVY
jgi:outer membrane receptor protein involved in Fe transport